MRHHLTLYVAALAVALGCATPLFAQSAAPASFVIEPIPSKIVIAPDYKVTDIDGAFGQLAGVYGGTLIDNTLFVGAAGYWLANGSDFFRMSYGGLVVGWQSPPAGTIRFGVRGLTGFGTATLPFDVTQRVSPQILAGRRTIGGAPTSLVRTFRVRASDDFFVFEPQATIGFGLFDHVTVNGAAGYRAVAFTDALRDRLHGPTASLGLEFGW